MGLEKLLGSASKASPAGMALGVAGGLANSIFGIFQGAKMLKEAKKINPVYKNYETSPFATANLGMAQMGLAAKNPAQAAYEKQMLAGQANVFANAQRAGLDPTAQAALGLASLGQVEQGAANLAQQNAAFAMQNRQDLMRANEAMTGEERMKYQSMLNKYQLDQQQKNLLRAGGQKSIGGAFGNIASLGFGMANLSNPSSGVTGGGSSLGGGNYQSGITDDYLLSNVFRKK